MDPEVKEIRKMLEKLTLEVEQNNRILRKMNRSHVIGTITRTLYWIIIIAISIASYYYLKPTIDKLQSGNLQGFQQFIPKK